MDSVIIRLDFMLISDASMDIDWSKLSEKYPISINFWPLP